jgi:glycosyltransferase involved in cell wall biosynthesis
MSAIDVIIPTYNNIEELKKCMQGFYNQTFTDFRLLICIDGSTDHTETYLRSTEFPFPLKILTHPGRVHRGRNASRNLAVSHLRASILVTLDSDMVPDDHLLEQHFRLVSDRGCVSQGQVIYTNRNTNSWADYIQTRGMNKYKDRESLPPYYLTTGNMAMPARYFIELRGQDASMIHYGGGDTEFAYRLHRTCNLPVIVNTKAVAFSVMNKDLNGAMKQMEEFGAVNLPYIRKIHPQFEKLFQIYILESNAAHYRLLRIFLNEFNQKICLYCSKQFRGRFRRICIHFLVIYSINQGYRQYIKSKKRMNGVKA